MGVTAAMACASLVAAPIVAQAQSKTQANQQKDVQVIAFQQTWNTIAKECTNTYGPEGVAYVEVSPPQESIQGTQWWTSYQPVNYKLDSKLGTEAEFKNMVQQCSAAGVGIIADVVLNQTTGADVAAVVEKGKAAYVGPEIQGKTLGVVGLGAIGVLVANAAAALGMQIVGYDPFLSVQHALNLTPGVKVVSTLEELYGQADYISLHLPMTPETKGTLNDAAFAAMKDGVRIVNLARGELVDDESLKADYASREPYGEWLDSNLVTLHELKIPNERIPSYNKEERARLQKAFGYTYEEYREGICSMALNGTEPDDPAHVSEYGRI